MNTELLNVAAEVVLKIVEKLVLYGVGIAAVWVLGKLGKKVELKNITEAIELLEREARITVGELTQVAVEELKASSEDGKLSRDEIARLNDQLIKKTKAKMAAPAIKLLEAAGADIERIILSAGEDIIGRLK